MTISARKSVGLAALAPADQIEVTGERGRFEAAGHEPRFAPIAVRCERWIRWQLDIRVSEETQLGPAELYYDLGRGFHEGLKLVAGIEEGAGSVDLLRRLPGAVRAVWLRPCRGPGSFTITRFRVSSPSTLAVFVRAAVERLRAIARSARPLAEVAGSARRTVRYLFLRDRRGLQGAIHHNLSRSPRPMGDDHRARYDGWRTTNSLTPADRQKMRDHIARMGSSRTFSVLMPVHDPPERFLRLAIESVTRQIYPHWQLCIADDGSRAPHVRPTLEEYAGRDPRIQVVYRPEAGGISAATNSALELASGDFAALLDHDDEVAEHALYEFAAALERDPEIDMLYSDEDKIDEAGRRCDPFFKPDWSPEYFLSCMYTCHLGAYRLSLLRALGGFRSEYDLAQDYDLVLRFSERARKIHHVPDVLYHWRTLETSVASSHEAKPRAHYVAQRAIQDHLDRNRIPGQVVDGPTPGYHHVRFTVRDEPMISLVMVSALKTTDVHGPPTYWPLHFIRSIRAKSTYRNYEILLVHQKEIPADLAAGLEPLEVQPIRYPSHPFNWSDSNNHGAAQARGEYLLFLNDDMEVRNADWLECMLGYAQLPGVGAVGAKHYFPDETLQHVGVALSRGVPGHPFHGYPEDDPGYYFSAQVARNCVAVTGSSLMTPRATFQALGGFDTEDFPQWYQDVDYGMKLLERGQRIVFTPHAGLTHFESISMQPARELISKSLAAFQARWTKPGEAWPRDPYNNPNFCGDNANCITDRYHRVRHGYEIAPAAATAPGAPSLALSDP